MTVEKLLEQLMIDLGDAKEHALICEQEYNEAIDSYCDRGTVTYFYSQYELSLEKIGKLQSAINIINERIRKYD